jgi:hypothetical protein
MLRPALFLSLLTVVGCGDNMMMMDMKAPPDMARGPLDHPPSWQMMNSGGPTQTSPQVWTVVWQGSEAVGKDATDFIDFYLKSDFWKTIATEYGVGPGKSLGMVVIPTPPPLKIDDGGVQTLMKNLVMSGAVGTPDKETQLALIVPATTTVTTASGNGCQAILGYHGSTLIGAMRVAYSVNILCTPGQEGEPFDSLTQTINHETVEAATDVAPNSGWAAAGPRSYENADLCAFNQGMPLQRPADATHAARTYWVQRNYSGVAAKDPTKDPCIPAPWDHPYWNVALDPPQINIAPNSSSVTVQARLDAFAYGDVGEIHWFIGSSDANIKAVPASGTAHAGDTIPVSITFPSAAAGVYEVDVESASATGGSQFWFAYVVAQ